VTDPDAMLVPQAEGIPVPRMNTLTRPFWDACATGRLTFQRCTSCRHAVFNPAPICSVCHSTSLAWEDSAGLGSVYSWTVAYRPLSPAFTAPYAPVIVDMDEGYQIVSNVIGCRVGDLAVGMRVAVEFHGVGDVTLPYFRPVS
jgi:uncharacterized OB-fold protein